jgi:anti-sigma factor ChrR (cupin superfamily)
MKTLSCASTRRRLQAYHDGELPIGEQIAVSSHIEWCQRCARALSDVREVGSALHALLPGRLTLSQEDAAAFTSAVVNRLKAEDAASLFSRVRVMFSDMRLSYAGLGATAASTVCVVIMLTMMAFAPAERPDSLRAMMSVISTPLDCDSYDLSDSTGCQARWAERFQRANEWAEQDAVFALEIVVTRQGGLANIEGLRSARSHASADQAQIIDALLDLVQQARLDQRMELRLPTAIYLQEQTTVRASKQPTPLDVPLPQPKKRASVDGRTRPARA